MKSKVFNTNVPAGDVSFNVIPLVDCAFLMILFFILTSQLVSSTASNVDLPRLPKDQAQLQAVDAEKQSLSNKILVNVVSAAIGSKNDNDNIASEYQLDGEHVAVGDLDKLVAILKRRKESASNLGLDNFQVIVRADRRVDYNQVEPVLIAASEANIPKLNITVTMVP